MFKGKFETGKELENAKFERRAGEFFLFFCRLFLISYQLFVSIPGSYENPKTLILKPKQIPNYKIPNTGIGVGLLSIVSLFGFRLRISSFPLRTSPAQD